MIGKILGNRYRVLRELGSGGMARVYLAEDGKASDLVAIKILYPQFSQDMSYVQRFNREAKLASTLKDSHIVSVLDYGADRDDYYLVMEYVEGRDLRELLRERGRFDWRDALDMVDQLATALEEAHSHGVVHRDIKPQNMMMTETGLLKVLDFGIARISTLPSLTQSGFVGSPYYVSPEQAMGDDVDVRSDIYSAGIVLYELISGNIPFDAKSPWSIINQHISHQPPAIELVDNDLPPAVHNLLSYMIAKNRDERFPNPTALRQAITAILAGQPIPAATLSPEPAVTDKAAMAASLYDRAVDAIHMLEWARAVDLLRQALALVPGHGQALEKLTLAERQLDLTSLYTAAKRALMTESWQEAITNLDKLLALDPNYEDATELQAQARLGLDRHNADLLTASLYDEGVTHYNARSWAEAERAFMRVRELSPGYKRVDILLPEVSRLAHPPSLGKRLAQQIITPWGLGIVIAVVIVVILSFSILGNGTQTAADTTLRNLYGEAQTAIENNNPAQAVAILDQILDEDPNYADAAELRLNLLATLTPVVDAATPTPDLLLAELEAAQDAIESGAWTDAIDLLLALRETDPDYEAVQISTLLCDAYAGRGLDTINRITPDAEAAQMDVALTSFQAGVAECPRRIDLQEQSERAANYITVLDTPAADYATIISLLNPIVAANPNYAAGIAKQRLYEAYLGRGNVRYQATDNIGALSDYEAAIDLGVDDPSEAQRGRAEVIASFGQPTATPMPTPTATVPPSPTVAPVATVGSIVTSTPTPTLEPTPTLTPTPSLIRFDAPTLVAPPTDTVFNGTLTEVFVSWESVGQLRPEEYYDVTVMHIFADAPRYTGYSTTETQIQLRPQDIGVGEAGNDRFYWWVTVRRENSGSAEGLDAAISPQSEQWSFIWTP